MTFPVPSPVEVALTALEAQATQRRQKLTLLQGENQLGLDNRRYTLDFECTGLTEDVPQVFRRSFTVRDNTVFYVTEFVKSYTAVGPLASDATTIGQMQLAESIRVAVLTWRWRIQDTARNREWSNDWAPSTLLLSANDRGLRQARAKAILPAGARVEMSLEATFLGNVSEVTALGSITKHRVQVSFVGGERRLS